MREQQVVFPSQDLKLEGLYAPLKPGAPSKGAVVCHPHPQYGGSMYNNVVEAALEALWNLGFATLRFNFRGVGGSEGGYGGGGGEAQDAVAAIDYLRGQIGAQNATTVLVGYSFGAAAAWRAAAQITGLDALVLIAAPLRMMNIDGASQVPRILLIAGAQDSFCPASELAGLCTKLGSGASSKIIDGADHFFAGYEGEITQALEGMLKTVNIQP